MPCTPLWDRYMKNGLSLLLLMPFEPVDGVVGQFVGDVALLRNRFRRRR